MTSHQRHTVRMAALALLLALQCGDVQAQHRRSRQVFRAYPTVGATVSQIRGDELRGFKKWGFTAGVGAIMSLSENEAWQLSLETAFSQRGSFNNTYEPYALYDMTLNYVDIPLSVHFTDPYGGMTFGVGLVYSRLVQQPHGQLYFSPGSFEPDSSDMSFLKNDLCAAIDFRFPIWRGLTFNARYQHSIIPVKKSWQFTEYGASLPGGSSTWSNKLYNSSLTFRLMYVFGEQPRGRAASKKNAHKNKKSHRRR